LRYVLAERRSGFNQVNEHAAIEIDAQRRSLPAFAFPAKFGVDVQLCAGMVRAVSRLTHQLAKAFALRGIASLRNDDDLRRSGWDVARNLQPVILAYVACKPENSHLLHSTLGSRSIVPWVGTAKKVRKLSVEKAGLKENLGHAP
jgi:hypothetical protein